MGAQSEFRTHSWLNRRDQKEDKCVNHEPVEVVGMGMTKDALHVQEEANAPPLQPKHAGTACAVSFRDAVQVKVPIELGGVMANWPRPVVGQEHPLELRTVRQTQM